MANHFEAAFTFRRKRDFCERATRVIYVEIDARSARYAA
jgi:hypothetical protein